MTNSLRLISLLLLPGLVLLDYSYPSVEDGVVSVDAGEGEAAASPDCTGPNRTDPNRSGPNHSGLDCPGDGEQTEQGTGQSPQDTSRPVAFCSSDASKRAESLCKYASGGAATRVVIQGDSRPVAARAVLGGQALLHLVQSSAVLAFCIRRHGPPGPAVPNSEFQAPLAS